MGLRDESRDAFWNELDVAYFLRHEASEIAWHTRHLYYRVNSPDPVVKARIVGQNEALQIMVYTQDRKDLFVTICRYFDRRSLSVQDARIHTTRHRSEEHTSELQSLMRISYAVFCLQKKKQT